MLVRAARAISSRSHAVARAKVSATTTGVAGARMATTAWASQDASRRPMLAAVKVKDLAQQVEYYTKHFGMTVHSQSAKTASLGYGPLSTNFAVQLTEAENPAALDIGTGFGHFGIVLPDVYAAVAKIKEEGGTVTREAGPVKGGNTVIAFVKDPSGYLWELLQRGATPEPLCQVMLRTSDLPKSVAWYKDVLGMGLVRERDNAQYKYSLGFMGYGPEDSNAVMELTFNYPSDPLAAPYTKGNAYSHVTLATGDAKKTAEAIRAAGGVILEETGNSVTTEDPDGWRFVFVEEKQ